MKIKLILITGLFTLLLIPGRLPANPSFLDCDPSYRFQEIGKKILRNIDSLINSDTIHPNNNQKNAINTSLFERIYQLDGIPQIKITTNIKQLINRKFRENYQVADFQLLGHENEPILDLPGRIRARGNMRKKVSYFPPVKLDFEKSILDSLGFLKIDNLKLVFPRDSKRDNQKKLFKEFLLYEIYSLIDSNAIRTKLVDISIYNKSKEKHHFTGFLIEDEDEYARRKNAIVVEAGTVVVSHLDRESFLKLAFFQYMIANTDWSVMGRHNIEMVKFPDIADIVAIPYDFDYAGFVGHSYAVPNTILPIKSVQERYFYPAYSMQADEYYQVAAYFLSIEEEVYQVCDKATYLDTKSIRDCKAYFKEFFDMLRKPERLKVEMVKD